MHEKCNRTVVEVKGWPERVTRDAGILSLGSCFSMEIGNKLAEEGYGICSNPFGVLYNPASIANSIDFLAHGRIFTDSDVVPRNTNPVRAGHTVGPQPGHRPIAPDGDGYVLPPRLVHQKVPGGVSPQCQYLLGRSLLSFQESQMDNGHFRNIMGIPAHRTGHHRVQLPQAPGMGIPARTADRRRHSQQMERHRQSLPGQAVRIHGITDQTQERRYARQPDIQGHPAVGRRASDRHISQHTLFPGLRDSPG